jgi:hypothetical protein
MDASWSYVRHLTQQADELGIDLTLIGELMLNDIQGIHAPSLDAWSTAAALAARSSPASATVPSGWRLRTFWSEMANSLSS